jgi:hypothetical protein
MNDAELPDELRSRLQASDPAASLPPAAPHEVARLLEDVMATELTTENRATGTHNRGPLTWLVAAAAILIIAGVGIFGVRALTGDDPDPGGVAAPQTVTALDVPATAGAGKCMVPNAEVLSDADVAFDGTVTSIIGDRVTLEPSHWYAGDPTDTVVVTAPSEQLQRVASAVIFRTGGRYLVSATDGHVSLCGFSAPYDEGLAAVYAEAFPT